MTENFKDDKLKLKEKQDKLLELLIDSEKLLLPFQHLCNELYSKLLICDINMIEKLLLIWFKAFLGYKDECMVLSKGELIRKYHIKQHKKYIHSREKERHYYNMKYKLTSISCDGIDYEYRELQNKYPGKSMESIASKCDSISERVDNLSKELDITFHKLEDALKKRHINVKMILIHNGEQIMITGGDGISQKFELLRGSMNTENSTKEESLTTTLDEDLLRSFQSKSNNNNANNVNNNNNNINNNQTIKKRNNIIYDSDEDKEKEEIQKKRLKQLEKEKRKEETNFQMDVSLDQLKNNINNEYENNGNYDDDDNNNNKIRHIHNSTDQWTIDPRLIPLYKLLSQLTNDYDTNQNDNNSNSNNHMNNENTIDNHNHDIINLQTSLVSKSKSFFLQQNPLKEKDKIVMEDHLLRMRVYISEQKYGYKYVDVGVYVNWNVDIDTNKPPIRSDLFVYCDDILLYLFKYLLTSHHTQIVEFPYYIVINDVRYSIGDKFNLPKDKKVLLHVHCYDNDSISNLCFQEIMSILNKSDNDNDNDINKSNIIANFKLIGRILKAISISISTNVISINLESANDLNDISFKCLNAINDTVKRNNKSMQITVSTKYTKISTLGLCSLLFYGTIDIYSLYSLLLLLLLLLLLSSLL